MRAMLRVLVPATLLLLLAACVTAYQPLGATGGYQDEKLEKDTFRVSFLGNGNTPRPIVLKYFVYRCAELTLEQGYEYFEIYAIPRGAPRSALDAAPFVQARGTYTPPTIVYVPGQAATRWRVSGVIRMYPKDILGQADELFSAREVVGILGAEVRAEQVTLEMPPQLNRVEGKFPLAPRHVGGVSAPQPATDRPVRLDDLKDLLPK